MKKTRILAFTLAMIMCFSLVAGCSGSSSSGGSSAAPSASSETIKIGLLGPYTGDVAQYGIAVYNGAELYINQINANGGINGKQVEIVKYDEKGDATEAVNAYNKMVEDGVTGIIGDVTSTPSIAVAQQSVADNMPMVTASATAADVISYGSNMFRACVTDPYQGKTMADFAQKQGYTKVGIIYNSGDDYSTGCAKAFTDECGSKSITVVSSQGYAAGDVDFKAQLTAIMSAGAEAIFCPNYYQDNGKIVTQARQLGYKGAFLGCDGWDGIVGGDEDYAAAADLSDCYYCSSFVADNSNASVQQFITDYTKAYGAAPTNFNALGYDAAMVLLSAIATVEKNNVGTGEKYSAADIEAAKANGTYKEGMENGGKMPVGSAEYKQAIVDAIAGGTVQGVTGEISYKGTGDPVKSAMIVTIKDGAATFFENF